MAWQEQDGFSEPCTYTLWHAVLRRSGSEDICVTTRSADQEAKAVLARSCGYLLWHKIKITLFVLEHEQNLTLT